MELSLLSAKEEEAPCSGVRSAWLPEIERSRYGATKGTHSRSGKVLQSGLWEDCREECQPFCMIPGFPIRASSEQVQDGLWQLCSGPGVLQ